MKTLRMLICFAVSCLLLYSCDFPDSGKSKKSQSPSQQQPKAVRQQQPQQKSPARSVGDDVNSVVNYGIGATQMKVKQNAQNRIQKINQQKNQELEDAPK